MYWCRFCRTNVVGSELLVGEELPRDLEGGGGKFSNGGKSSIELVVNEKIVWIGCF
ncbi:MAG: hypothetical protein LBJ83_02405 [Oscillospiraceae bacterium]|nr:hypothetical protein [Oscillospiraceae bacterium]